MSITRVCASKAFNCRVLLMCGRSNCVRTSSSTSQSQQNDYFTKNEAMKRPIAPFVIYKLQLTSVLSFSHRMTGLALGVLIYGGGIAALMSADTNFAQVLQSIQNTFPSSLISTLKFLTVTSFAYHALNGIRHLAWDIGYGFTLKELYTSGYVVLGLTLLAAIGYLLKM